MPLQHDFSLTKPSKLGNILWMQPCQEKVTPLNSQGGEDLPSLQLAPPPVGETEGLGEGRPLKPKESEAHKKWRLAHRDSGKAAVLRWRAANRDKINEQQRLNRRSPTSTRLAYEREYARKNRKEINAKKRAKYRENPEMGKASRLRWYSKNKPKCAAMARSWRMRHKGYYAEYWKDYRNKNRWRVRINNQRAKARLKNAYVGDRLADEMIKQWVLSPDFKCSYCGEVFQTKAMLHVDHKTPLIRGGLHTADNICQSCGPCNIRKNRKTVAEFLATKAI